MKREIGREVVGKKELKCLYYSVKVKVKLCLCVSKHYVTKTRRGL
jgi:hypothetical protein